MYPMTNDFQSATTGSRQVRLKCIFNGSVTVEAQNIIDMQIEEALNTSDGITMGGTCSSKLTLNMFIPDTAIDYTGAVLKPYIGLVVNGSAEYCPMGVFFADTVEKSGNKYKITAYDKFSQTDVEYIPSATENVPLTQLLNSVCSQCNITLASAVTSDITISKIKSGTCRQQLGWIAGLLGKNARFNRFGNLEFVWYTAANNPITQSLQIMGGLKQNASSAISISSLTSGTSDDVLTTGTGIGITFENPYMTQDILSDISTDLGDFVYYPISLQWRGNPAIQAGDILSVATSATNNIICPVVSQTIKASGGLFATLECHSPTEETVAFSENPTDAKINAVYKGLKEAILKNTSLINGNNGGTFAIIDSNNDGVNDGWVIYSADRSKYIVANINGIGITTDGGTTFKTAITPEGINGQAIYAGSVGADKITVGDGTLANVINLADGVVGIKDKNGDILATFSSSGATWADMQEIKYCGFVWKKSRYNGNLRLTKQATVQ